METATSAPDLDEIIRTHDGLGRIGDAVEEKRRELRELEEEHREIGSRFKDLLARCTSPRKAIVIRGHAYWISNESICWVKLTTTPQAVGEMDAPN